MEEAGPFLERDLYVVTASPAVLEALQRLPFSGGALSVHAPKELLHLPHQQQSNVVSKADVVLVDWGPDAVPAFLVLQPLSLAYAIPVFALCRGSDAEQVAALMMGADDALSWPLKPILLEARLRAYARLRAAWRDAPGTGLRAHPEEAPLLEGATAPARTRDGDVVILGRLMLDHDAGLFYVDGTRVALTPLEYDIMREFMLHPGVCLAREVMMENIWAIDFDTETNVVDARIYGLRRKLRLYGLQNVIVTVRGRGYRLDV